MFCLNYGLKHDWFPSKVIFENIAIQLFFNLNSFGIDGYHLVIVIINERFTDGWRLRMLAYQIARWAV